MPYISIYKPNTMDANFGGGSDISVTYF